MGALKLRGRLTVGVLEGGVVITQSSFYLRVFEPLKMLETGVFVAVRVCILS